MNENVEMPGSRSNLKLSPFVLRQFPSFFFIYFCVGESNFEVVPFAKSFYRVNGFNLWFSDNRGVLTEDNTELSSGDLVKLAMRTWKALNDEEKAEWNKKAKEASVDQEQGEKKRKRDKSDEENEDITNKLNQAKKAKEVNNSASKLAGFAYSKKD